MARDYSPEVGRFIQPDPLGVFTTTGPTGLTGLNHTYGYANQNSLSFTDSDGLEPGTLAQRGYISGSITSSGFNTQACVQNYLNQHYGSFVANTMVPNFSLLSYLPGSGVGAQAWTGAAISFVTKGLLVGAPYVAGQALNLSAIASATAAQMTMQSLAPALTPGASLIAASKLASGGFGLFLAATLPLSTAANAMALQSCSCSAQ
jgi:hypothetical protein